MGKKKRPQSDFDRYLSQQSEDAQQQLRVFFADLRQHLKLSREETAAVLRDFEAGLLWYHRSGVPLEEGLRRLPPQRLGGFYARPPILWYPLDNAAKIYPLSMKRGQMAIFRLSVYLDAPVQPPLLQLALTYVIQRFPSFATTVKKGFFWHYLDANKRRYAIQPESGVPCHAMTVALSGSPAFRVVYWQNRISVEYFHILTDGTGGMTFLSTLCAEYLRLLEGVDIPPAPGILQVGDAPLPEETENAFLRVELTPRASGFVDKPAVQLSGALSAVKPCRVLHFRMDAEQLRQAARARNATVTSYLLSLLFVAGRYATDEPRGSMSIQVPVNMRKFYPSATVRNFSMYCGVRLPLEQITDVSAILPEIDAQLREKGSQAAMSEMVSATCRLVGTVRCLPLFIKSPAARAAYGFLGDQIFSNTLSNLGVVRLPPEMTRHIDHMDFVLGTSISNRASCTMVTVGNQATLSVSKLTADPSFEEKLYALLCADGLSPLVEGSPLYEH